MFFAESVIDSDIDGVLVADNRCIGKVIVHAAGPLSRLIGQRVELENIQTNGVEIGSRALVLRVLGHREAFSVDFLKVKIPVLQNNISVSIELQTYGCPDDLRRLCFVIRPFVISLIPAFSRAARRSRDQ